MALVSQALDNLLNGVSQQPPRLRLPSQSAAETNTLALAGEGLRKRPGTAHVAALDTSSPASQAFVFPISYSEDERYIAVLTETEIRVFNAETGAELTVHTPDGVGYLDTPASTKALSTFWRHATVQDMTVLVNRSVDADKLTTAGTVRDPEALVYIRQADYGTSYTVTLDGNTYSYTTAVGTLSNARPSIATDAIATELKELLDAETTFTITRYGSTLHIVKDDGSDFTISSKDGLADAGLLVIKGKTQRFSDLPPMAVDGFIVEITGDPGTDADNYWVRYDDADLPDQAGVWVETIRPGRLTSFDPDTMPHVLLRNGSYIPEFEQPALPEVPTIEPFGSGGIQRVGFETSFHDPDIDGAGVGNNNTALQNDAARGYANLKFANGLSTEYTVNFGVNTTRLDPTNAITITVQYNVTQGASVWTTAATRRYEGAGYNQADSIVFTAPILADRDLSVLLSYDNTPVNDGFTDERANITLYGEDRGTGVGVEFTPATDIDLIFDPDEVFPVGYSVTVDVDGTPCTYTVATAAETGTQIATAFEPTIEAVANISSAVTSPGTIRITRTTSGVATVSITSASPNLDDYVWVQDRTLVVDSLNGMIVENVTDGSSATITDSGVDWIQVAALTGGATNVFNPGDTIRVKASASTYFIFREAEWTDREAGDDTSNPFPSFTGKAIDEVFFTEGRLGFTSEGNVILSEAGDYFDFFRDSATALRDADPIDVTSQASVQRFHAAVEWNERIVLWAEKGQYLLEGNGALSPRTVSLRSVGSYESDPEVRPVPQGAGVFFPFHRGVFTQVSELRLAPDGLRSLAFPITTEVPRYLLGDVQHMAGVQSEGLLAVLTDSDDDVLYTYCYHDTAEGRDMGGWRTWQFPAGCSILGFAGFGSSLAIVIRYSDGIYLETLDLAERTSGALNFSIHLDRLATPGSVVQGGGNSTFTLPYSVATNGSEGTVAVIRKDTGEALAVTRTAATEARVSGTFAAADVWVGISWSFLYTLSPLFIRADQNKAVNPGRLDLRWLEVITNLTRSYTLRVAQLGRTDKTLTYTSTSSLSTFDDLRRRLPLLGRTEELVLSIEDSTPQPLCLTAFEWEGNYSSRSRRV